MNDTTNSSSQPLNLGDLLKYEEDCLHYSREVATVAAGQKLTLGSVVGRETATGKLRQLDALAVDGRQTPVGVLLVDVDATLVDVEGALLLNLKGEFMTGVHCLCSPEFFDALTDHVKVKDAFAYSQQRAVLIEDMRAGFTFGGVTFEEYRGQATAMNGVARRFIAAGDAHAFPLGTVDTFSTYYAPADFNETANTLGQALYAKQEPRKFDRGTDLHTQSNPLPMCHRPGVLVKLTMA